MAARWPQADWARPLFLQQDNARLYIAANEADFLAAVARSGLD